MVNNENVDSLTVLKRRDGGRYLKHILIEILKGLPFYLFIKFTFNYSRGIAFYIL